MKSILYITLSSILFSSCKAVDIRTEEAKNSVDNDIAKILLEEMQMAHGTANWSNVETYSLFLNDQFEGFMGKNGNPYPKNRAYLKLEFINGTFTGRGTFLDGKWKDKVWGIQSWKTYSKDTNGEFIWDNKNDKDTEFWIPTYQYFIELPQRIEEADILRYAGQKKFDDKTYDLIYATWKNAEPQKDIDQYMLWINAETKMLDIMQ